MNPTATLAAQITLDTRQYQQAAQRVQQSAQNIQNHMAAMNAATQQATQGMAQMGAATEDAHWALNQTVQTANRTTQSLHTQTTTLRQNHAAWQSVGQAVGQFRSGLNSVIAMIGGSLKGLFASATVSATAFFAYMTHQASEAWQLLADAVRLNIDTTNLQQWEFAAKKVGISVDKVRDIMKDVNDKMGDFISTGGGEAKDIFEKLSLDAEELIGIAPDKVLEKIAVAAEGLSVQDKTFLFESIADDASLLLPLLEQNAAKLKEIKQEALSKGVILSESELNNLKLFNTTITNIWDRITGFAKHLAGSLAAPMEVLLAKLDRFIQSFGGMDQLAIQAADYLVNGFSDAVVWIAQAYDSAKYFFDLFQTAATSVWDFFSGFKVGILDVRQFLYRFWDAVLAGLQMLGKAFDSTLLGKTLNLVLPTEKINESIQQMRDNAKGAISEVAKEIEQLNKGIQLVPSVAEKWAGDLQEQIQAAWKQTKLQAQVSINTHYQAQSPTTDFDRQRSLSEYQLKQAQAGAEDLKKSTEALKKQLEQEQQAAEKQNEAANKMLQAANKMSSDSETDTRAWLHEEIERLTAEIERKRELGRKEIAEMNQQRTKEIRERINAQNGNAETEALKKAANEMAQAAARIPEQQAASAQWAENLLRQQERLTGQQIDLNQAREKAIEQLVAHGSSEAKLRQAFAEQEQQAAQLQFQAADKMQQAATQFANIVPATDTSEKGIPAKTLTVPQTTQNIHINLSGDIGVKLDGANETVAKAVVASPTFQMGVAKLVQPELLRLIQGAVVSVGSPLVR